MDKQKKEFSKIYDKFIERIFRFIFLKVNSRELAEDLTSETFLRTWEYFKTQKIENVPAFLYKIARNLIIDHYREKNKISTVSAEILPIADHRNNLEKNAILNSDLENIKKALSKLNQDYQNAIIWYYIDNLPIKEVADLLERSEGATRVLISRAIKALREKIKEI